MNGVRERFFRAMRREGGGFVPFEFSLCPSLHAEFERRTGTRDYVSYYDFPVRSTVPEVRVEEDRFSRYFKGAEGEISIDRAWGVGNRKGSLAHFTEMVPPMKGFTALEDFRAYPYPDPVRDFGWDVVADSAMKAKAQDRISVGAMEMTIFEIAWYTRGMEQFMVDMLIEPELVEYHLDRITEIRCEMARRFAASGVDVLRLGDDIATQRDMMMSLELYRRFIKPRLAEVIEAARAVNPGITIFYHSDGNPRQAVGDLVEIGVQILNPIQPECMDPVELKHSFGDRLSFWGTVGTQSTMPFGTPDDVRDHCTRMIGTVGKGGGLFLAPTHVLEPEVPWENIEAFIETVVSYNSESPIR